MKTHDIAYIFDYIFLNETALLYSSFTDVCQACNWQYVIISAGDGLALNRWQAINRNDGDQV